MYSVQKAAAILGIAENTTRAWMKRAGVKGKIVATDRRRRYLSYNDVLALVEYKLNKDAERENEKSQKLANASITVDDTDNSSLVLSTGETVYTFAGAASLLGVAVNTVKK